MIIKKHSKPSLEDLFRPGGIYVMRNDFENDDEIIETGTPVVVVGQSTKSPHKIDVKDCRDVLWTIDPNIYLYPNRVERLSNFRLKCLPYFKKIIDNDYDGLMMVLILIWACICAFSVFIGFNMVVSLVSFLIFVALTMLFIFTVNVAGRLCDMNNFCLKENLNELKILYQKTSPLICQYRVIHEKTFSRKIVETGLNKETAERIAKHLRNKVNKNSCEFVYVEKE